MGTIFIVNTCRTRNNTLVDKMTTRRQLQHLLSTAVKDFIHCKASPLIRSESS